VNGSTAVRYCIELDVSYIYNSYRRLRNFFPVCATISAEPFANKKDAGKTYLSIVVSSPFRPRRVNIHLLALFSHHTTSTKPSVIFHSRIGGAQRRTAPGAQRPIFPSGEQYARIFVPKC
jgi:hypothetical protein